MKQLASVRKLRKHVIKSGIHALAFHLSPVVNKPVGLYLNKPMLVAAQIPDPRQRNIHPLKLEWDGRNPLPKHLERGGDRSLVLVLDKSDLAKEFSELPIVHDLQPGYVIELY